jgi:hypothetical protein
MKLEAEGHNFWGAGFGDYEHNAANVRADGSGYEGISFWARSARNAEKSFVFNVDDGRTMLNPPDPCAVVDPPRECSTEPNSAAEPSKCMTEFGLLAVATASDQDLDGDGCVGPGDIASGSQCRLPPPEDLGDAACYNGGVNQPSSAGTRVPAADECGNAFHTLVTTTARWQLFIIPWSDLVQWPCPNRLRGGIDRTDIAKFEIKFLQGTRYELWIDDIAFYRRR